MAVSQLPPGVALSGNGRGYIFHDTLYPRVTSIKSFASGEITVFLPTSDDDNGKVPVSWEASMAAQRAVDDPTILSLPRTEAVATIASAAGEYKRFRGSVGSEVHDAIYSILTRQPIDPIQFPESLSYLKAFKGFMQEWRPRFHFLETFVLSDEYNYGGNLDAVAEFPSLPGKLFILDWKTSKSMSDDFGIQFAAYRYAQKMVLPDGSVIPMPRIDGAMGIHLQPTGKATPYFYDTSREIFQGFVACRHLWRLKNEMKQRKCVVRNPATLSQKEATIPLREPSRLAL